MSAGRKVKQKEGIYTSLSLLWESTGSTRDSYCAGLAHSYSHSVSLKSFFENEVPKPEHFFVLFPSSWALFPAKREERRGILLDERAPYRKIGVG